MEYFKNQQLQENLGKYNKDQTPNESLRSLNKQIELEISCKMKNGFYSLINFKLK